MRKHGMTLTCLGLLVLTVGCPATGGGGQTAGTDVNLATGFGTVARTGETRGDVRVDICDGWFPMAPNLTMSVDDSMNMTVRVTSDEEPRLWILCGQSNFCGREVDINTWEQNRFWTSGVCDVYVGTPDSGGLLDFAVEFLEN